MKNRFNNLTSKEWLPYQKSWFKYSDQESLYRGNLRFFVKYDEQDNPPNVFYYGSDSKKIQQVASSENATLFSREHIDDADSFQFAMFNLLDLIDENTTVESYLKIKTDILNLLAKLNDKLVHRRFIVIFIRNVQHDGVYFPFAWDLAKNLAQAFTLKDEKIGCFGQGEPKCNSDFFHTDGSAFYSLYFRNDENSLRDFTPQDFNFFENTTQHAWQGRFETEMNSWYILKPKPRNKDEILHPAKFPEELIELFLPYFTDEHDNVFDPMCGTGSTLVASLRHHRNAYGVELSRFFEEIAEKRCREKVQTQQTDSVGVGAGAKVGHYKIICQDAREINSKEFPQFDYIITSPPYWDMLNMKGAEGQARRKEKGLQLNYSDDTFDLGNIDDYNTFLNELVEIYFTIIDLLKPKKYFTIVVKNIKKKGKNYPLAWDLSRLLQKKLILLPEVFWLQDDIRIAPYGYGNTWVSNTFHHYCLTFQKP